MATLLFSFEVLLTLILAVLAYEIIMMI